MKRIWPHASLSILFVASGSVMAAQLPKEGSYDLTSCFSMTELAAIRMSKADMVSVREVLGTVRNATPGGFLDMSSFRCVQLSTNVNGTKSNINTCEAVDSDGDKMLTRQTGDGKKYETVTLAGTGKYEGIVRTGNMVNLGSIPPAKEGTVQGCFRQTGTYKLK